MLNFKGETFWSEDTLVFEGIRVGVVGASAAPFNELVVLFICVYLHTYQSRLSAIIGGGTPIKSSVNRV